MGMGSETETKPSTTPKLPLFSLTAEQPPEPPGIVTPPLQTQASVPFQWEEAPGKPLPSAAAQPPKPKAARSLDLPPRLLLNESKMTNLPSPTTVLDGPYSGRSLSHTMSFKASEGGMGGRQIGYKERSNFSSWRWGSFKDYKGNDEGSFDFSPSVAGSPPPPPPIQFDFSRVKITRVRKRRSFFSSSKPHLSWASIYESVKQAVWRRQ